MVCKYIGSLRKAFHGSVPRSQYHVTMCSLVGSCVLCRALCWTLALDAKPRLGPIPDFQPHLTSRPMSTRCPLLLNMAMPLPGGHGSETPARISIHPQHDSLAYGIRPYQCLAGVRHIDSRCTLLENILSCMMDRTISAVRYGPPAPGRVLQCLQ